MTNRLELQATEKCANYDDGMCLPSDKPCKLKQDGQTCLYFAEAVQPCDPVLKAQYERGECDALRQCERCNDAFTPTGKRQLYCPACSIRLKQERTAERVRRYRNKTRT